MYNPYQYQPNILPPQQVLQANGKTSIDAIRLSPNSSVLVMDTTAPIIWLCTTDSLGNVTSTPYDITPHRAPENPRETGIEERLTQLERKLERLEEMADAKSNAGRTKSKQTGRNDEPDSAD